MLLGELPLRRLLDWGRKDTTTSGGAPAARGHGAALDGEKDAEEQAASRGGTEGGGCFWGSSRCARLLHWGREEAASLGELPLRGAA